MSDPIVIIAAISIAVCFAIYGAIIWRNLRSRT